MTMTISGSGTITGLSAGGLPSATVTQATLATPVAGTGPAFSAYNSSVQGVSSATYTKVILQSKEFDTANAFDNTTNYRFQPSVAGYYQVNGAVGLNYSTITLSSIAVYKNGSAFKYGVIGANGNTVVDALIYLNGSTDYIELYGYNYGTGTLQFNADSGKSTFFQASLVRGA